jgi:hypothetical protein
MNDELGRISKWPNSGTILREETEKNMNTLRISGVLAEIRSENV